MIITLWVTALIGLFSGNSITHFFIGDHPWLQALLYFLAFTIICIPLMQFGFALWSLVNTRSFHTVRLKKNLGWVWVTALVVFISMGSYFSREFSNVSQVQETETISGLPEILELNFENAVLRNSIFRMDAGEFEISDNNFVCKNVETSFSPTILKPQIVKIKHARGVDFSQAKERAGNINYQIAQENEAWKIPTFFDINKGDQWRAQKIILDFQIPIGQKIKIAKQDRYQISGINYTKCQKDDNFYFLEMTSDGLQPILVNS